VSADAGVDHLLARITGLEGLVRRAVDRRRGLDPTPDDPFRGLYISDDQIDRLLSDPAPPASPDADFLQAEADADAHAAAGSDGLAGPLRLHALAAAFALDESDVRLLLVALAPDLDPRFERFYGYLNDDVTRRRATIGLALELSGGDPTDAADRSRVTRLADAGLMLVEEPDRPYLGRSLRVPDHVTAHLLGDDRLDPAIRGYCPPPLPAEPLALAPHIRLVYLREPVTGIARNRVTAAGPTVVLDAERIGADADIAVLARIAAREALILGAHLVVGPVETLAELDPAAIRAFADQACRVVLTGRGTWDPKVVPQRSADARRGRARPGRATRGVDGVSGRRRRRRGGRDRAVPAVPGAGGPRGAGRVAAGGARRHRRHRRTPPGRCARPERCRAGPTGASGPAGGRLARPRTAGRARPAVARAGRPRTQPAARSRRLEDATRRWPRPRR